LNSYLIVTSWPVEDYAIEVCLVSQAVSENMDVSDFTFFESDVAVTVMDNPTLEQAEQNSNIVVTSNDDVIICTDSICYSFA
jgi:hypothetical protein